MKTPFGSRVNFRIDLDFRIEDGRSFLQFRNTRMGNMAMPGALRDKLERTGGAFSVLRHIGSCWIPWNRFPSGTANCGSDTVLTGRNRILLRLP